MRVRECARSGRAAGKHQKDERNEGLDSVPAHLQQTHVPVEFWVIDGAPVS